MANIINPISIVSGGTDKKFVKVNEFTLTSAQGITLNHTDDGEAYDFQRILILIHKPAVAGSAYGWICANGMSYHDVTSRLGVIAATPADQRYYYVDVEIQGGRLFAHYVYNPPSPQGDAVTGSNYYGMGYNAADNITQIEFYGAVFPAGTEVLVYAIK